MLTTIILYTLITTHITIACVTLYLHRSQSHRAVTFHPVIAHAMRAWLWLTTGMITKQWVAIHRQHHRRADQQGDPHSPHVYGILRVVFTGVQLYSQAAKNTLMVEQFGVGTPEDRVEQRLYTPYNFMGIVLYLLIDLALFGPAGLVIWLIQMVWIPFWAAGVINGLGHWWGYRNGETKDQSRNLVPWGIVVGGEELHNNHHLDPASAKLSRKPWEFDIGYLYIQILSRLKLATLKD